MALGEFRAIFMPYCLDKQPDGTYAVLNRRYKPIGFTTHEHVEYGEYPVCVKFKRLSSTTAARLSWKGDPDTDRIYLYNDGCIPTSSAKNMRDYLQRLEILAHLEIA